MQHKVSEFSYISGDCVFDCC